MRKQYPSDITREQFEQIRPLLEGGRKKTAPRKVDLYEVFCAILYLLKSGCQWRMLAEVFPNGLPFTIILAYGIRHTMETRAVYIGIKKLIGAARTKQGRKSCKSRFLIVDAQSVKNTDSDKGKGYDAGKKYQGQSGTLQSIRKFSRMP